MPVPRKIRNGARERLTWSGCLALPVLLLIAQDPAEAGERWGGGFRSGGGFNAGGRILDGNPYPSRPWPGRPGGHGRPPRWSIGIGPGIVVGAPPAFEEDVILESAEVPRPIVTDSRPAPRKPVRQTIKAASAPDDSAKRTPVRPDARPRIAQPAASRPQPTKASEPPRRPTPLPAGTDPTIVPDEVLCEIRGNVPSAAVERIARGYGLARLSSQPIALTGSTLYRWRIVNGRPVNAVVNTLRADPRIASAQPNYVFRLQGAATGGLAAAQYAVPKLHLDEAHKLATGAAVPIAVIDSGVDPAHPELVGALSGSVNVLDSEGKPHAHGTAVAGIIGARGLLTGAAPQARILAIRAFSGEAAKPGAAGTTAHVLRALEVARERGARIVNLSFSGPHDPLIARALFAGRRRGTIFVAAAGNGGPQAAPGFPAADANVIAVTATDAADRLYPAASRGTYVTLAAPGVDILAPAPAGAYQFQSGTSMAAAYVSSLAALLLEKNPGLSPEDVRTILTRTARDLGPAGPDPDFGAGQTDALAGVKAATAPPVAKLADPEPTVSLSAAAVAGDTNR
jgi:subtilisin family serine protease